MLEGAKYILVAGLLLAIAGCWSASNDSHQVKERMRPHNIPPQAASLLVEAQHAFQQDAYRQALTLADSVDKIVSDLSYTNFLRGRIYTELHQYVKAQAAYKRVVRQQPQFQGVWFNMGNNAFRDGQMRKAIGYYRKEQQTDLAPQALLQMGRAYDELGEADSARWAYNQVIESDRSNASAYYRLGQVAKAEGALEKALSHSQQALRLDPPNTSYKYQVGALCVQTGQVKTGLKHLKEVVEQWPWHRGAHYTLAQAFRRINDQKAARQYQKQSEKLGKLQEEIEEKRSLAEMQADDPGRWMDLGHAYRRAGRHMEAIQAFQRGRYLAPNNLAFSNNIATLLMKQDKLRKAILYYRRTIEANPEVADIWLNLGVAYAKSDSIKAARQAFHRALELKPNHRRARAYLAQID